jgi:hypothetical protein
MANADAFVSVPQRKSDPADGAFAITPDDANTFDQLGAPVPVCRGIYVGVAGDVSLVTKGGQTLVFKNATAGSIIPVRAKQVTAANTSATNLIALF